MINESTSKRFCCEDISKIENYDKAVSDTNVWDCHHRLELVDTGAVVDSTAQDLKDWGLYYKRPADELIYILHSEHASLHHKGRKHSKEHSERISRALVGVKRKPLSDEHKRKISDKFKGRTFSDETRRRISERCKEAWKRRVQR